MDTEKVHDEKIKYLENKINNMIIDHPICHWATYSGSHCRRTKIDGCRFCTLHQQLMNDYTKISSEENNECSTSKIIKIIPRSYKHIRRVMNKMGYEDDSVDVYMVGGLIEEADLSDTECVTILSDDYKYYYRPKRGQGKAKNIKIILKQYCENSSVIEVDGIKYCEECYKNLKGVPKFSVL